MSSRSPVLLAIALVACASRRHIPPTADAPPALQLPDGVRPVRYAIALDIDPAVERFRGTSEIRVELATPARRIWMHARELRVTRAEVVVDGGAIVPAQLEQVMPEGVAQLVPDRTLEPGVATLKFEWDAPFHDAEQVGLYRSRSGADTYASTQLEPIYARALFPCFDEPRFKTPFELSLVVPAASTAISNTPQTEDTTSGGRRRLRFAPTRPLPTYLLFAGVGPFDVADAPAPPTELRRSPLAMRFFAPRGRIPDARFASSVAPELLASLERWFGLAYPYPKLDHVAVPGALGGMENPGAIAYVDALLLTSATVEDFEARRLVLYALAHEMAHQWFGDLVTLPWWTDAWLNEGFATYLGRRVADAARPEWGVAAWRSERTEDAMRRDALTSSRAVRRPLRSIDQVNDQFDVLTYEKGAAILETIERWIGKDRFRTGVASYVAAHEDGTGTLDDLVAALAGAAGRDVAPPLRELLDRPGVPLVRAALTCDEAGARLQVSASRYRPRGSRATGEPRVVPVCARWQAAVGAGSGCVVAGGTAATLDLGHACPAWVHPDEGGAGYYRWALAPADLARLQRVGLPALVPAERRSYARSVVAAERAGELAYGEMMDALAPLAGDPDPAAVRVLLDELEAARDHEGDPAARALVEGTSRALLRREVPAHPFEAPQGEDDRARERRVAIVEFLARVGRDREIRAEAARRGVAYAAPSRPTLDPGAVAPGLALVSLEVALEEHGPPMFDALVAKVASLRSGEDRFRVLLALASADAPALASRQGALWRVEGVDPQERLQAVLRKLGRPFAARRTMEVLDADLDAVVAATPEFGRELLPEPARALCEPVALERARSTLRRAVERYPAMRTAAENALEEAELCETARRGDAAAARAWFAARAR